MSRHVIRAALVVSLLASFLSASQDPTGRVSDWLRRGDLAALTAALEKDPGLATRPDDQGIAPLIWASLLGNRPAVDLLLARGADPNVEGPVGGALFAAAYAGHPDIIRVLAAKGADVNGGGKGPGSPLVAATRQGQAASVEALLELGASVNAKDAGGNTALLLAASFGRTAIVQGLLARRADRSLVNQYGSTPLDVAVREGHADIVRLLRAGETASPKPASLPTGAYMGQAPPGETRRVFAPGVVSTERRELNAAFTPDGRTFFFSRDRVTSATGILMSSWGAEGWQPPAPAPFSTGDDVDMFVTDDGLQVFFCSDRATPGQQPRPSQAAGVLRAAPADIWVARRQGNAWGSAEWLGPEVNSPEASDYYPTMTVSGTLYFSSNRSGGLGGNDIYRARRVDGRWAAPENLGAPVNTSGREFDPFIAPDESYLLFASERPGGLGAADLYISVRRPDGSWGTPAGLGPAVNSPASEYTPMISPDGRYLFFTCGGVGSDDICWIDANVVRTAVKAAKRP